MKYLQTLHINNKSRLLTVLLLAGLSLVVGMSQALAGAGEQKLRRFHKSVKAFQAPFKQRLVSEKGTVMQSSTGTLYLSRPGKFRWNYESPDRQQIVSDGTKLWIFDEELDQVTIKHLKKAIGQTPARVLSENTNLDKEFVVKDGGSKDGVDWAILIPKKKDGTYSTIKIGFKKTLSEIKFVDKIGQTTEIRFFNLKENPKFKADLFTFVIPAGVDVIGDKALVKGSAKAAK